VKHLSSPALTVRHDARQQVFATLVAHRDRSWTVASMTKELPAVTVNDVRTTLHLLLGDRLMAIETAAQQRSLTLRLTGDGEQILMAILRDWDRVADHDADE